jgi:hypothetical protein
MSMARFVMVADTDTNKIIVWDGKKQVFTCNFGEAPEGGWAISTVQEVMVLSNQPKHEKILYMLHDSLSDAINAKKPVLEPV